MSTTVAAKEKAISNTPAAKGKPVSNPSTGTSKHAVADQVIPEQLKVGMPFPPQSNILEVEVQTAARVAKVVFDAGLAMVERPTDLYSWIEGQFYHPRY
jgi:malate dehydrogenase (oxaloacetate-decarboxylating)(NADP+)